MPKYSNQHNNCAYQNMAFRILEKGKKAAGYLLGTNMWLPKASGRSAQQSWSVK